MLGQLKIMFGLPPHTRSETLKHLLSVKYDYFLLRSATQLCTPLTTRKYL